MKQNEKELEELNVYSYDQVRYGSPRLCGRIPGMEYLSYVLKILDKS